MPTIPSAELIERRLPQGTGRLPGAAQARGVDVGGVVDDGTGLVSRALANAGAQLQSIADGREARQNRLAAARARTKLSKTLYGAFQETDDNEYGSQVERFSEMTQEGLDEAASLITDPEQRALFMAQAEAEVTDWGARTHQRALVKEREFYLGELEEDTQDMLVRATTAPDEDASFAIITEYGQRLEGLVGIQALDEAQAASKLNDFRSRFATIRLGNMTDMERAEALKDTSKGWASWAPGETIVRMREQTRQATILGNAQAVLDASGGRLPPLSQLQAMEPGVRKLVEDMAAQRRQRARAAESYAMQRQAQLERQDAEAREEQALLRSQQILELEDELEDQLSLVDAAADLDAEQKLAVRQLITRRYQEQRVVEEARVGKLLEEFSDMVDGGASLVDIKATRGADWVSLPQAAKNVLQTKEDLAAGVSPVSPAKQTENYLDIVKRSEDDPNYVNLLSEEWLEANLSQAQRLQVIAMKRDIKTQSLREEAERNKAQAASSTEFTRALNSAFAEADIKKNKEAQAKLAEWMTLQAADEKKALGRDLTPRELFELKNRAVQELVFSIDWWPDETKRLYELTGEDDLSKVVVPRGFTFTDELRQQLVDEYKKSEVGEKGAKLTEEELRRAAYLHHMGVR